ncbi:DNA helicase [Paraburkholderia graminis]|uniref:helicase RepA family protein n=1 Tax=Paraburkholderia graminis TaxID=60548 RepID=UPI000DEEC2F0|nr:helicase RepA family protein [Paraburkholderia graminis]AXF10005.1 DNA helicase [Paraburkholderia graminis]
MNLLDHRLDIRKALSEPPPPLDHVLPGLLAGTVGALIGPGGVGKTMLLMQIACDIAAGKPVGGGILTPHKLSGTGAPVVFLLAEESRDVMQWRLQAALHGIQEMAEFKDAGACDALVERLSRHLLVYPLAGAKRLGLVADGHVVEDALSKVAEMAKSARLLIVDPLRRFHSGEENDSSHMTNVVGAFERIAAQSGAAVLLSHHANRSSVLAGAGEHASASRGSSALTDSIRWQANLSAVTESTAGYLGIAEPHRRNFVRLDIAKANYGSKGFEPLILRRDATTGALAVAGSIGGKRRTVASDASKGRRATSRHTGATNVC